MNTTIIGTKQLRSSLPDIAKAVKRGVRFSVMRHHEHLFDIVPPKDKKTTYTLEDFEKLQFSDQDCTRDLSKKIDEIVYGV